MVFASPTLLGVEGIFLSNCHLCTRTQSMWDFEWSHYECCLCFLKLSIKSHLPSNQTLLGLVFLVRDNHAGDGGAQCGSQSPHSLGRISAVVIIASFVGCLTWHLGLISTATPTCPIVVPSLYLELWKAFYASLHVVFIDSCSVNSCDFGVPVGRSELRVFLFYHLGHSFSWHFLTVADWGSKFKLPRIPFISFSFF